MDTRPTTDEPRLWRTVAARCARAAVALSLAATACSPEAPSEASTLGISIRTASGKPPPRYFVVAIDRDAHIGKADCPNEASSDIRCTSTGVLLAAHADLRQLTIKAPGWAWRTMDGTDLLSREELTVELEALPAFEQTEDYATGLPEQDGEQAFIDLAVAAPNEIGASHSVKFLIIDPQDEPDLYLQNTRKHPLHYDFSREVLGRPATLAEFEAATYRGADRPALAGTLVYFPELEFECDEAAHQLEAPITLNFFPSDELTSQQILTAHRLIEERLQWVALSGRRHRLVMAAAGEHQEGVVRSAREAFAERDVLWSSLMELYSGIRQQLLNPGLAYGTLRLLTPEDIGQQVVSSTDVLVLTRLPNELPLAAGTITAELQTPLAHVNLAARARGTPNLALLGAEQDPRIVELLGQLVRFEVAHEGFSLSVATLDAAEAFWQSQHRELSIPDADLNDHGLPGFEEIGFGDSTFCGVKAANLGELRQLLGDEVPTGFVVPFWAYDQHMRSVKLTTALCADARADCIEEGRAQVLCEQAHSRCWAAATESATLREYAASLQEDVQFVSDAVVREACLDNLVYVIGHGPVNDVFAVDLDARVAALFPSTQVRLRSSTNAEDLPGFSGAGLYRSLSAEPSGQERASLRIRKVWASIWTFQAYEERRFWNIDSLAVEMGVAVHRAFDDEVANGVLITQNIVDPNVAGFYVNVQVGETSVTNPDNGALPEAFSVLPAPEGGVQIARQRYSSMLPNEPVLSQQEVSQLARSAARIVEHFSELYAKDASTLALDLEFKFVGSEHTLIIKQVRPYADSNASGP